jgi:UDP-glucose 4-epimerase
MEDYSEFYQDSAILVTGGAGAIAGNLCRKLSTLGAKKVIILDNLSSSYEWNISKTPDTMFVQGDILDDAILKRVFTGKTRLCVPPRCPLCEPEFR